MKKLTYYAAVILMLAAVGFSLNGCKKDGLRSLPGSDTTKKSKKDSTKIDSLIKKATLSTVETISQVTCMTVDKSGTIYLMMGYDNKIYKVSGGTQTVFYTSTSADTSQNYLFGLSADSAGNVYTIHRNSFAGTPESILKISPSGTASTFMADFGQYVDPLTRNYLYSLSVAANGDVFYNDVYGAIHKISGGIVSTVAQTIPGGQFAVDKNENVYFVGIINGAATQYNISKVTAGGTTSVLAGPGKINLGEFTLGLSVDKWGDVFVSDKGNHTIYGIDTRNNVYTIASNYGYVDGPLATAKILFPSLQAIDGSGNIYFYEISESQSDIRKITR